MKKIILILGIELLVSAAFSFFLNGAVINYDFFTFLGLGNLIIGIGGGVIGLVIIGMSEEKDRSFLIASGLLLLLGCLTCTFFPIQINSSR